MFEIFTKSEISRVYEDLKHKKLLDRNKKLPIGVDGVSPFVFERNLDNSLNEIHRQLLVKNGKIPYNFAPLLRIEKTKRQGGVRSLHIPRLRDQVVFRLIHNEIQRLSEVSSINLKVKSPYSFVTRFDSILQTISNPAIVKADITQFYDSIPRKRAVELCYKLGLRKELYELMLKWSDNLRIRSDKFSDTIDHTSYTGLPQGLSLSSLLSELYVREIDQEFKTEIGYFRYVDDMIIVCQDLEDARFKLKKLVLAVQNVGLTLSPHKTAILRMSDGLEWLGLVHYPGKKFILQDKLNHSLKIVRAFQKECFVEIMTSSGLSQKVESINKFISKTDKFITGHKKHRLKWYALVEDTGQWKLMDKYIHGLIHSCIRKSGLDKSNFGPLPSVHAKVISYKKIRESQNKPNKGNAPVVC